MVGKPNEFVITRVYDAPLKLVWDAWTDLKHVAKWWGPRGFTITTKSKDLRPGGKWIYTMHGPDGTDYPNIATYHEVIPYEKLVYDHGATEDREKLFTVTATFREENGKTVLHMISEFPNEDIAKVMKEFIKNAGGTSTWDRLGEYLEHEISGKDPFIIQRSFEGSLKDVFAMWQDPALFAKWLGPKGAKAQFLRADIKEGGKVVWDMTAEGGPKNGTLHFQKIVPNRLFVYNQYFSDKEGKLTKAPFPAPYPDELLTTVTFDEEDPKETRVSVRWDIIGNASEAERKSFHEMKSVMTQGWNESFDKIDEMLKK